MINNNMKIDTDHQLDIIDDEIYPKNFEEMESWMIDNNMKIDTEHQLAMERGIDTSNKVSVCFRIFLDVRTS